MTILSNLNSWVNVFLIFWVMKWESCIQHFCLHSKVQWFLRQSTMALAWLLRAVSWPSFFFHGILFSLERTIEILCLCGVGYIFGRHFLKCEQNDLSRKVQGKQLIIFIANDTYLTSQLKTELWKTCISHCERNNFPVI